jgi:hypothetical protein
MVARLTPDQKVACSIHVRFTPHLFVLFFDRKILLQNRGHPPLMTFSFSIFIIFLRSLFLYSPPIFVIIMKIYIYFCILERLWSVTLSFSYNLMCHLHKLLMLLTKTVLAGFTSYCTF